MTFTPEDYASFRKSEQLDTLVGTNHYTAEDGATGAATAPSAAALPLLSIADLAELPPPTWVLDELLPSGFSVLFGPSNVGKSFLALDWSLCIATGECWYGKQAADGWVVYIAAEGVHGLYRRVQAWMHARDQTAPERIRFIPNAANLLDGSDLVRVATAIARLPEAPKLIVVDTMARCMVGGDENSAKDVGRFIAGVEQLSTTYETNSLVVHHTGKDGEGERGSSALRGAADAMLALKPDGPGPPSPLLVAGVGRPERRGRNRATSLAARRRARPDRRACRRPAYPPAGARERVAVADGRRSSRLPQVQTETDLRPDQSAPDPAS